MTRELYKTTTLTAAVIGLSAVAISFLTFIAHATLVMNGDFTSVNRPADHSADAPSFIIQFDDNKNWQNINSTPHSMPSIAYWNLAHGTNVPQNPGAFLVVGNTATTNLGNDTSFWPGCPSGSNLKTSVATCNSNAPFLPTPNGGNFVAIDDCATPTCSTDNRGKLTQQINGLVPETLYQLSFYEAIAQQRLGSPLGDPTNASCCTGGTSGGWEVSLGTEVVDLPLMNNDSQSFVPWKDITLAFKATNATEILQFFPLLGLGVPPFVLVADVSLTAVPEPQSYMLLLAGLLGILAAHRRQKRRALFTPSCQDQNPS